MKIYTLAIGRHGAADWTAGGADWLPPPPCQSLSPQQELQKDGEEEEEVGVRGIVQQLEEVHAHHPVVEPAQVPDRLAGCLIGLTLVVSRCSPRTAQPFFSLSGK